MAKLLKIIDRAPEIDCSAKKGRRLDDVKGDVEVTNVAFAYPAAPDKQVMRGFTLSIGAGQTLALCGPSGSGKSTIVQLLERFYDPAGGAVTVNGRDLRALPLAAWRRAVGYLSLIHI